MVSDSLQSSLHLYTNGRNTITWTGHNFLSPLAFDYHSIIFISITYIKKEWNNRLPSISMTGITWSKEHMGLNTCTNLIDIMKIKMYNTLLFNIIKILHWRKMNLRILARLWQNSITNTCTLKNLRMSLKYSQ